MEQILSPLTSKPTVKKIEEFSVSEIISLYDEMGVDVKRFFHGINIVTLYQCTKTNYRFYHPFSIVGDSIFYKDLSINHENYYSTRWEHLKILTNVDKGEKVLEIGSGFGVFLKLLKSKGIRAEGIELNPLAITTCEKIGLKVHNLLIDVFAKQHLEKFDVVCYFQVLEHIVNVHDFIKDSLRTIKPNGKLIIGVPNNNPYLFINDKYHTLNLPPHHAGLWNKKSLKSLEKIFNIKLESVSYEPLDKTYSQFLTSYMKNINPVYNRFIIIVNKIAPRLLKLILCKCINGRNILVVFRKLGI